MYNCIDEYETSKLNAGQIFFILASLIPLALCFPTWLVAKFIYEPWVRKLANMREDIPPVPYLKRWILDDVDTDDEETDVETDIKNIVYEHTPKGNVLMRYNSDDEVFEYWCDDGSLLYKELDVVARKYVKMFKCKSIYVDRVKLQKEKFNIARDKYFKEKEARERGEEIEKEKPNDSLFVKTKGEKAKEENENYMEGDKVNLNKLLLVDNANKFKRLGKFAECKVWFSQKFVPEKEKKNLSFASFKGLWSSKNKHD